MQIPGISKATADTLKKWFVSYVQRFDLGIEKWQQNITLKEQHSKRVSEEICRIGECLQLGEDELRLAEIIGLFHDIGRFEQYARYKTFVDGKSENHAELGVKIIKEMRVLENLDGAIQQVILRAILYHNRAELPEDENHQILFYARLLRDADKLDIYRVLTDYYNRPNSRRNDAIELDLPDTAGFSEILYEDLIHHRIVKIKHVKNFNDFKLMQVGWVFDINFDPTFQLVKERGYLQLIQKVLPESQKLEHLFQEIQQFLEKKILPLPHLSALLHNPALEPETTKK